MYRFLKKPGPGILFAGATFTTMFSTILTTLDASPRAMSYSTSLFTGIADFSYFIRST